MTTRLPTETTTNIHAPAPFSGRVRLTADLDRSVVTWCEVYDADGSLTGCGPTVDLAPGWARDQIELRSDMIFPGSMYWLRPC